MGYFYEHNYYISEPPKNSAMLDIDDIIIDDDTDDDEPTIEDEIFDVENTSDVVIENRTYYIGLPVLGKDGHYLYSNHISAKNYFAYNFNNVNNYLRDYSYVEVDDDQPIEIMETHFAYENIGGENVYVAQVVLKTCWLRIFQRIWRHRAGKKQTHI